MAVSMVGMMAAQKVAWKVAPMDVKLDASSADKMVASMVLMTAEQMAEQLVAPMAAVWGNTMVALTVLLMAA